MSSPGHEILRALAQAVGVASEYWDVHRNEMRYTSDATREKIVAALGFAVGSEGEMRSALEQFMESRRAPVCDAVRVAVTDEELSIGIRLPDESSSAVSFSFEVALEHGERPTASGLAELASHRSDAVQPSHFLRSSLMLPPGYHDVFIEMKLPGRTIGCEQRLIVSPAVCPDPEVLIGDKRGFGIAANLYTVRDGPHAVGTVASIAQIGRTALRLKSTVQRAADFVGINPLHALRNRGNAVGPYSPVSRLYRNILYLNVFDVPELSHSSGAQQLLNERQFAIALAKLNSNALIDYEESLDLILPVLKALHETFREDVSRGVSQRSREYAAYRKKEGRTLDAFAAFEAIGESLRKDHSASWNDWREWPREFRDVSNREVHEFSLHHETDVDFHRFIQFELDRQLSRSQEQLVADGMRIGIYSDLALSSSATGFDTWYFRDLFVPDITLGAPPDAFAHEGQTWGIPPVSPLTLTRTRYEYWSRLLRTSLDHCGMLRIDHVMGLWRQFWVPEGGSPREGAYVFYPTNDLLGILALESSRARALVVGEDLGTVPDEVRPELARRRIMSSKVMYFERREHGRFAHPEHYPSLSLASCNTHDLPTLAQWWLAAARWEREFLLDELRTRGLLSENEAGALLDMPSDGTKVAIQPSLSRLVEAVNRFLCAGSSLLVSLALDDLALETESVNKPGVPMEEHASWSRRMSVTLDELPLTST